ncbi:K02A2.6-like [Cordylochernes scorpioides]|uniref:K02A2.6-like n=1 Tax=Cordylochernes scorpioides TaxID=51811 RepID=A0ABY6K8I0_9ARAC|nr:K02A2.6-like [Cordylochernes scorpioides]
MKHAAGRVFQASGPPDLQSWIFEHDLEDDSLAIMASAKTCIYKYFLGLELRGIYPAEHPKTSENHHSSGSPFLWQYLSALPLEYERVSKYNRWDDTMKLANVVFYLNGTAGRWFDNNEESLISWRSFEDAFRGVFGTQEDSARRAEEVLKSRAQKAEEFSESYIQEILCLCH